jgi:DNA-binding beta-propeller fold protein YncE
MTRTLLGCYLLLAALLARPAQAQNVGIGTSAPTQALDVNGQVRVRGAQGDAVGRLLGLAPDGTLQAQPPAFSGPVPTAFAQPIAQAAVATVGSPVGVAVNPAGTRAFVISNGSNALETFDLSGAGPPRKIGSLGLNYYGTRALKLNSAGTRLYVLADVVLYTFAVSSGLPVQLAVNTAVTSTNEVVIDAAATAAYVLASGFFIRFTLDNNGVPSSVPGSSSFLTTPSSGSLYKLALNAAGTRLYMLVREAVPTPSRLYLFDVSTAGTAVILGSVPVSGVPAALVLNAASTRAYVVSVGSNTLQTFDLSGALPVSLGTVPTGRNPADVALNAAGTRLYVPNTDDSTLQIYDISGAGLPVSLAANPTSNAPRAVATALADPRLYVVNAGDNTLQVFDQQNQPRPLTVGATGAAGSLGTSALPGAGRLPAAYGTVSSGSAAVGSGSVFSVTHAATGVYRLNFISSPLSTTDLNQATVVATLAGVAPGSVSYRTGPGYVEVLTYAPGGAATDRGFTFSVALP